MNIHPIFIHFPIALLVLYVVFEVLPLERWYPKTSWVDIKAVLVMIGGLGLLASLTTGELAEGSMLAQASKNVLHVHKAFAGATTAVFGIIAAAYLIRWIYEKHVDRLREPVVVFASLNTAARRILNRWIVVPLALLGFCTLFLTGTLGGIIVYGPNIDFVTKFVYGVFFG